MAKRREGLVVIPVGWAGYLAIPAELADKVLQHGNIVKREYKEGVNQWVSFEPLAPADVLYITANDIARLEMLKHMTDENKEKI